MTFKERLERDLVRWVERQFESDPERFAQLYPGLKVRLPPPEPRMIPATLADKQEVHLEARAGPAFTWCGYTWLRVFEEGGRAVRAAGDGATCRTCIEARTAHHRLNSVVTDERARARMKVRWTPLRAEDVRPTHRLLLSRQVLEKMVERGEDPAKVFGPIEVVLASEPLWLLIDIAHPRLSRHVALGWRPRPGDPPSWASEVYLQVEVLPEQGSDGRPA